MEEEVDDIVGPRGKHNPERVAVRHGHDYGEVTLGGRRVEVRRPRARTADGESEVPLTDGTEDFGWFVTDGRGSCWEADARWLSTRRYRRTQEPVGEEVEVRARSTSKSAVSQNVVERTRDRALRVDLHASSRISAWR